MKTLISTLLYHANKYPYLVDKKRFYEIKSALVRMYGKSIGYDLQYIEGKSCHACYGTGNHEKYGWHGEVYGVEDCWHCDGDGWYKNPQYNILERYQFGKYVFHQPIKRFYSKRAFDESVYAVEVSERIEGYIKHSKGNRFLAHLFCFIYMRDKWITEQKNQIGKGYYRTWWRPYNFLNNLIGLFRSKSVRLFFIEHMKDKLIIFKQPISEPCREIYLPYNDDDDDFPF